ncbi:MAG: hypothetical protein M3Z26_12380 [Bacteroidota bacterium]|nr:hypothetical protein [Bacteroidota bacterium]
MLQNRVDPKGNIIKTSARGLWMGNRGQLHNEQQNLVRSFKLKAWITCLLEFNSRKRKVMSPNRYTELFFLDEATAFAAGHRPCFECRREDYKRFKNCWLKGNHEYGFDTRTSIREIDRILHEERINTKNEKLTYQDNPENLPDGTFILFRNQPYLIDKKYIHGWSPFGYEKSKALPKLGKVSVLTPKSIVIAFGAGYRPQMDVEKK